MSFLSTLADAYNSHNAAMSQVGFGHEHAASQIGKDVFAGSSFGSSVRDNVVRPVVDALKVVPSSGMSAFKSSSSSSGRSSMESSGGSGSQPQTADYLDAPWASAYGMSKDTAYNEAMTNTEYRRAVKDMQAAGLNPAVIFGAGKGSTAGVPGYISSSSRGGGGGGGSGRSRGGSAGNKNGYLFSGSAYSVISALGGIVGAAATKSAGGYWIGTSLAQGAMHAASGLGKWFKH